MVTKTLMSQLGRFDRAKICEIVGPYILHKVGEKYGKENIGLYRDDVLPWFENSSGPEKVKLNKSFNK